MGGKDEESIDEIREKAKAFFTTQNRCVTLNVYKRVLEKECVNAESVTCWGG